MRALILLLLLSTHCAADYVLAFHKPKEQCPPCAAMEPVEDALKAQGYDIRRVMKDERPDLVAYYRVKGVPQYVYVVSTARGDYDSGYRIRGWCTPGQLRRFCVTPGAVHVGAATRNGLRALFSPVGLWVEW